jgi:four helix bundle protein
MGEVREPAERRYDLEERLVDFTLDVLDVVEALPQSRVGNQIASQLVRSGTSPAPNYGEARSAESRRDFAHKMKVVLKELRETRIWLLVIQRREMIRPVERVAEVLAECQELISIFGASIRTTESPDI